jgi:hypothetical protein
MPTAFLPGPAPGPASHACRQLRVLQNRRDSIEVRADRHVDDANLTVAEERLVAPARNAQLGLGRGEEVPLIALQLKCHEIVRQQALEQLFSPRDRCEADRRPATGMCQNSAVRNCGRRSRSVRATIAR